jgi:hypothetical protein
MKPPIRQMAGPGGLRVNSSMKALLDWTGYFRGV